MWLKQKVDMLDIFALEATVKNPTTLSVLYSVCLSFLLSCVIAYTYKKTFQGLSYSRSFLQAMILSSLVTALAMQAIGDNVARGMGMMGALAIIRFRSSLKDPRDMIFIFSTLSIGMACGVYSYQIAVIGAFAFSATAFAIQSVPFSKESHFDGLLKFNMESNDTDKFKLQEILKDKCKYFALVTLREVAQGTRLDYAYQIKLNKGEDKSEFIDNLREIETIKGLSLLLQESTVEI
ncbi:MAG: putative membrane protein YhiD involved in acid resistance [Bacteriovoracaceae bacterium]|jgi:uncharacterized membrane protein YhiD involved in acid resistance